MRSFLCLAVVAPLVSAHAFVPIRRQDGQSASATSTAAESTATSYDANAIPECAQTCFAQAKNQTTDCPGGRIACLCAQPEVNGYIPSCLEASCATADLESAAQYGTDLCYAVWKAEQNGTSTASAYASADWSSASASASDSSVSSAWSVEASSESAVESSSAWNSAATAATNATAVNTASVKSVAAAAASITTSAAGAGSTKAASAVSTSGSTPTVRPWLLTIVVAAAGTALML